ncbi:MAG: hypothetical protein HOE92_01760 [Euryarchaeota archaeon]|nr:hypothetical protein [Euryarchaeota archaeon]
MSEENPEMPPPPPGMPPAPPGMPPAPPGMPLAPPGMPPAPPSMPPAPPMMGGAPPAPPGMPPAPPMDAPPAPPMMGGAPPAPPGMPPAPPMDAPPAPPGMPPAPPMDAPPAPPGMPPAPPMDAPPAPPGMPPAPPMDAPPAPPEMPPAPPMNDASEDESEEEEEVAEEEVAELAEEEEASDDEDSDDEDSDDEDSADSEEVTETSDDSGSSPDSLLAPPAPPGMPPAPPMDAPPAPPGMPPAPPMDAPPAPPGMPPAPPMDAPPAPPGMPPAPPASSGLDSLLSPPAPPEMSEDTPASDVLSTSDALVAEPSEAIAGAKIRTSTAVDDIPGDKIIGYMNEVENSTLSADGTIVKQNVKGVLTIENPSESDRLWDIDVLLNAADATNIGGDHISITELEAGKSHSQKYDVKNSRMLVVSERIDTNPARSQERSLSVALADEATKILIEIEVENVSAVSLNDVIVTREIPSEIEASANGAEVGEGMLTWNVGTLASGQTKVLNVDANILVSGIETVDSGALKATYSANATLSTVNFKEVDAFCRGFSFMQVDEDERPDNWQCKAVFENRSSFAVDLVKLQVRMADSGEMLFDIADVPEDILPDGKWESEMKFVEASEKPNLINELGYTVIPRVSHSTEGSIDVQQQTFTILEANLEKKFSTGILRSYRQQEVGVTITISNNGSSDINLMRFTDDIPGLFEAPNLESMRITMDGTLLSTEQYRAEVKDGITLEEFRKSPDGPGHSMTLTVGTKGPLGLAPGKSLEITYTLVSPDPSPDNLDVAAPAKCEFSAERFGPVCSRETESAPAIRVSHKRRKFSAGKTVIPVGGKGRYEVLIMFENRSDSALQDLAIHDILPSGFEISDCIVRGANREKRDDVDMKSESSESGTTVEWNVPVIGKGERLEISLEIKGSGEFDAQEMQKFHGATFGDEIDEDLPAPAAVKETADSAEVDYSKLKKAELVALCEEAGLDVSGTKAVLIDSLTNQSADVDDGDDAGDDDAGDDDAGDDDAGDDDAGDDDGDSADEAPAEDAGDDDGESADEAPAEDTGDDESNDSSAAEESKDCPICGAENGSLASACGTCGFTFA